MAGGDEKESEARKWEMRIPRRAGGRKLWSRSYPRQCCTEEKAQGHIPHRREQPTMAVPRTGGERDIDGQRGGYRYPRDMIKEESIISNAHSLKSFWRGPRNYKHQLQTRAGQERQINWRAGVRGRKNRKKKGTGISVWRRWERSPWKEVCNCVGEREGDLMEMRLVASWWWAVWNGDGRSG